MKDTITTTVVRKCELETSIKEKIHDFFKMLKIAIFQLLFFLSISYFFVGLALADGNPVLSVILIIGGFIAFAVSGIALGILGKTENEEDYDIEYEEVIKKTYEDNTKYPDGPFTKVWKIDEDIINEKLKKEGR